MHQTAAGGLRIGPPCAEGLLRLVSQDGKRVGSKNSAQAAYGALAPVADGLYAVRDTDTAQASCLLAFTPGPIDSDARQRPQPAHRSHFLGRNARPMGGESSGCALR